MTLPTTGQLLLTDGGLETTLLFHDNIDLPAFSAGMLLRSEDGRQHLRRYFESYIALAKAHGTGFVLETATWRTSHGWSATLGVSASELEELDRVAVREVQALRRRHQTHQCPLVVSGNIGPRGDGYVTGDRMTVGQARAYHGRQVRVFAEEGVDCVTAMTMNYIEEAAGIALAARDAGLPSVIAFTVETDGNLITGDSLQSAIEAVDKHSGSHPAWFMINCAHPSHFSSLFREGDPWLARIGSIRANASKCSHAELDEAEELDVGDPAELAAEYEHLLAVLPNLRVLGGCCGTDIRHIEAIAKRLLPRRAA